MKITTWNAEWLEYDWGVISGKFQPEQSIFIGKAPTLAQANLRIAAIATLIARIDPDILFLCEAPVGQDAMLDFTNTVLPDYELVVRSAGDEYHIRGNQWLWFLVRKSLAAQISPTLLPIGTWRVFAAAGSRSINVDGSWTVASPKLTDFGNIKDVPVSKRVSHRHFRHPQVLRFSHGGAVFEVIGAHLKSKFVKDKPRRRRDDEDFNDYAQLKSVQRYLARSHEARIKLTSEALNIRAYVDHRFNQDADPSILVLGDLNDGPGKELMEREYLLHDMISNLQGEVFFARNFLNHALFDQPQELRWTALFQDLIDPERNPRILLDHILFTQAMTRGGTSPLVVDANGGRVEHLAAEETAAIHGAEALSDHRPVSVTLTPRSSN